MGRGSPPLSFRAWVPTSSSERPTRARDPVRAPAFAALSWAGAPCCAAGCPRAVIGLGGHHPGTSSRLSAPLIDNAQRRVGTRSARTQTRGPRAPHPMTTQAATCRGTTRYLATGRASRSPFVNGSLPPAETGWGRGPTQRSERGPCALSSDCRVALCYALSSTHGPLHGPGAIPPPVASAEGFDRRSHAQ